MKQWNEGYRVKDYTPFGTDVFHDHHEKLKRVASWDATAATHKPQDRDRDPRGHDLDPMAGLPAKGYSSIHDFGSMHGIKGVSSQPVLNTMSQGMY